MNKEKIYQLRDDINKTADLLFHLLSELVELREGALAFTRLQESIFWCHAAFTIEENKLNQATEQKD